jgi:hypothetical protein
MVIRAPMTLLEATIISLACRLVLTIPTLALISSAQALCAAVMNVSSEFDKARAQQRRSLPRPQSDSPEDPAWLP